MNQIKEALGLWVKLTGVSPNQTSFRGSELSISIDNDELKKTFEYDDTGTTTLLFLDALTDAYLNSAGFSINDIIYKPDKVDQRVALSRKLYSILRSDELNAFRDSFRNQVRLAATSLCKDKLPKEAEKMLVDNNTLSYLRRDAVRAANELRIFQFLQGVPDEGSKEISYHPSVFEFWNINSLIRALCTIPSGIMIALIRDPIDFQCYFVFGMRNGGTISILTDKPKHPHPHYRYMTRRPDRSFGDRAFRHHFPYDLMDWKVSEEGEIYFPSVSDETGLVPYQNVAHPLKTIKELHADEIIWITMMFDLIISKFFKNDFKTKELAYTGEMVKHDEALIGTVEAKALVVTDYPTLKAKVLKTSDVTAEKLKKDWERTPTGDNKWLEDKFAPEIAQEALNLLGPPGKRDKYLDTKTSKVVVRKEKDTFMMSRGERSRWNQLVPQTELDTTSFGTKKEVLADQRWVARYNFAKQVDQKAKAYYEETNDEVVAWYREHLFLNMEYLVSCIIAKECMAPGFTHKRSGSGIGSSFGIERFEGKNILKVVEIPLNKPSHERHHYDIDGGLGRTPELSFHNGYTRHYSGRKLCYFDEGPHSYVARFEVTSGESIAVLCSCKVADLPEPLQHFKYHEHYGGNSILDRLDPMDWVAKDPWTGQDMSVRIFMSKRSYIRIMKGTPLEELPRERVSSDVSRWGRRYYR